MRRTWGSTGCNSKYSATIYGLSQKSRFPWKLGPAHDNIRGPQPGTSSALLLGRPHPPPMQAVSEFAPLLAFIVAYYLRGLYAATAVLMVAMLLLLAVDWLRLRRIPPMHALSALLVMIFGAATLLLHNKQFIQWKPTVLLLACEPCVPRQLLDRRAHPDGALSRRCLRRAPAAERRDVAPPQRLVGCVLCRTGRAESGCGPLRQRARVGRTSRYSA